MLGRQFASQADGAVGSVSRIGVKNIRAIGLQNLLALRRNIARHAERDGKSLGRTQHGIGYSSIAASGVEKNLARSELAAAPTFGDDVGRCAVLHRAARVV